MLIRQRRNEIFLFALVITGGASVLFAQMDTGEDRSFAYRGYLVDGLIPATTPHDIQFALFSAPNADTSCLQTDPVGTCGVWAEAHNAVTMSAGTFSVMLGQGAGDSLSDVVLNGDALYLGVAVRESNTGAAFSVLGGLTELSAVPWAARAAAAKNYSVTGQLTAGNAVIAGNMTAASANVSGNVTAGSVSTGSVSTGSLSTGSINATSVTTTGNVNNTSASGQFGVSADKVFRDDEFNDSYLRLRTGATSNVYADFAAEALYANADLTVAANTWHSGPTSQPEQSFSNGNAFVFRSCPNGQYVCGMGLRHISGDGQYWTGARVIMQCCEL